MSEFESYYPPKPEIERKDPKRHISITILSIIVFALTFSIITDDYVLIGLLVGVLFLHELGHFLVMKFFGYTNLSMLFIPFIGAMVSGKKKIYSQIESSLMIMAGPVPGIVIGYFLMNYGVGTEAHIATQAGAILILLNVLNLIPLDPLDGGQLFRILYFRKYELFQFVFAVISSLSMVILGVWLNSWILTAFGVLLGLRIKSKHKIYLIRKELRDAHLNYEANYEDLSDKTYKHLKNIVEGHTPVLIDIKENSDDYKYDQIVARQVDKVLYPPTTNDASFGYKAIMFLVWAGAITLAIYSFLNIDLNVLIYAFQSR
tara:strand:- start:66286 stop:67236 length:951 start_codon:yes stop_codon:yes gene_type:complete